MMFRDLMLSGKLSRAKVMMREPKSQVRSGETNSLCHSIDEWARPFALLNTRQSRQYDGLVRF